MWSPYFEDLLQDWIAVREEATKLPLTESLALINQWWSQAPTTHHYLHMADYDTWPSPWELLEKNVFCDLAKCLGMVYTVFLVNPEGIETVTIHEENNGFIVDVNSGEYILNDSPTEITVVDREFDVIRSIDCDFLQTKLT